MKTPEVIAALRARHGDTHEWACLVEWERIDFLALACHSAQERKAERRPLNAMYPWIAYEVKVSRADFRKELERPHKRLNAISLANEFYFAAPAGLIRPEEVPADCGLVEVHPGGTRMVIPSPITKREPLRPLQVAQMLRHGMNPAWLRSWEHRKRSMQYREQSAKLATKAAEEREQEAARILADALAHTIHVGDVWRARERRYGRRRREEVRVVEKTDALVRTLEVDADDGFAFPWRIGEFLLTYERVVPDAVALPVRAA